MERTQARKEEGHEHLGTCLGHKDKAIRILYHAVAYLTKRVEASEKEVRKLKTQGVKTMASLAEVKAAIEAVKADIIAEKQEVQASLKALKDEIQVLKDQIAQGNPVTPADLDSLLSSVSEIGTGVKDISEPSVPV